MKNIKLLIISVIILMISVLSVNAEEAFLVDVSSSLNHGSVLNNDYEHYSYNSTQLYRQGDELYLYSNITNNSENISYISIEVLLFDSKGKNIGIFNYCSSKDYDSQFSYKKLNSRETVGFTYKITDKYLADADKNNIGDVASYTIVEENEYCKIGAYSKYYNKTLDQIINTMNVKPSGSRFDSIVSFINKYVPFDGLNLGLGVGIIIVIVSIIVVIAIWMAFGSFLNRLHFKMYNANTVLAYLPITNAYLCVKMAFGKIVGFVYLGISFLGSLLFVVGLGFIYYIAELFFVFAFVLDIIKLITGKYDLCYLDGSKSKTVDNNFENNNQSFISTRSQTNEYGYSQDNNVKESLIGVSTNKTLDDDSSDNMNVSMGNSNNNVNNSNNNNNSEESDLSKLFR